MAEKSGRKPMKPGTKMLLILLPIILLAVGWGMWQEIQRSPSREAGVVLSPYGVVTVRLDTDPFPALATGTVRMTLRLRAPGGQMVMADRLTYTYGSVDGVEVYDGEAHAVGMDVFQGPLRFTGVGQWWIKVRLEAQGSSGEAEFVIRVKPAI